MIASVSGQNDNVDIKAKQFSKTKEETVMNNEINLNDLMEVNGGNNLVHEYLYKVARKNDLFLEEGGIDLAAVKKRLTSDEMRMLSRLAINRPTQEDLARLA